MALRMLLSPLNSILSVRDGYPYQELSVSGCSNTKRLPHSLMPRRQTCACNRLRFNDPRSKTGDRLILHVDSAFINVVFGYPCLARPKEVEDQFSDP